MSDLSRSLTNQSLKRRYGDSSFKRRWTVGSGDQDLGYDKVQKGQRINCDETTPREPPSNCLLYNYKQTHRHLVSSLTGSNPFLMMLLAEFLTNNNSPNHLCGNRPDPRKQQIVTVGFVPCVPARLIQKWVESTTQPSFPSTPLTTNGQAKMAVFCHHNKQNTS